MSAIFLQSNPGKDQKRSEDPKVVPGDRSAKYLSQDLTLLFSALLFSRAVRKNLAL
jgi:hypothetical protein